MVEENFMFQELQRGPQQGFGNQAIAPTISSLDSSAKTARGESLLHKRFGEIRAKYYLHPQKTACSYTYAPELSRVFRIFQRPDTSLTAAYDGHFGRVFTRLATSLKPKVHQPWWLSLVPQAIRTLEQIGSWS